MPADLLRTLSPVFVYPKPVAEIGHISGSMVGTLYAFSHKRTVPLASCQAKITYAEQDCKIFVPIASFVNLREPARSKILTKRHHPFLCQSAMIL